MSRIKSGTYDQLHRLSHSKSFANFDAAANAWQQGSSYAGMYENSFTYDASGNIETQIRKDVNGDSLDVLSYHYHDGDYGRQRNRLYHVNDAVSASSHADDIDDQGTFVSDPTDLNTANNYGYDPLGQLIRDDQEGITAITWRNDGKVRDIFRASGVAEPRKELSFEYSPYGHRLSKKVYQPGNDSELLHADYYIRDAQGNVMATYRMKIDPVEETVEYVVTERPIYGSDRLGLYKHEQVVYPAPPTTTAGFAPVHRGERYYELKNHLGNVMAVVSGHKIPVESTTTPGTVGHFLPQILHTADYSPFGVQLQERTYEGEGYRYGFNGMEKDDEVKGAGNHLDFGARGYDSRLGRWLSVDPLFRNYVSLSGYQFAGNSPIIFYDAGGESIVPADPNAKSQLESTFDKVFGFLPEVRSSIVYEEIGKNSKGESVFGFSYNERQGGGNTVLSKRAAVQLIRKADNMDVTQKLEALAILDVISELDITEMQMPRVAGAELGINTVLTDNSSHRQAIFDYNTESFSPGGLTEETVASATGSENGNPGARFFENQNSSIIVNDQLNTRLNIRGLLAVGGGTDNASRDDTVKKELIKLSGGASFSDKSSNLKHSMDSSGEVTNTKLE